MLRTPATQQRRKYYLSATYDQYHYTGGPSSQPKSLKDGPPLYPSMPHLMVTGDRDPIVKHVPRNLDISDRQRPSACAYPNSKGNDNCHIYTQLTRWEVQFYDISSRRSELCKRTSPTTPVSGALTLLVLSSQDTFGG